MRGEWNPICGLNLDFEENLICWKGKQDWSYPTTDSGTWHTFFFYITSQWADNDANPMEIEDYERRFTSQFDSISNDTQIYF